jgi:erythromycin esterase
VKLALALLLLMINGRLAFADPRESDEAAAVEWLGGSSHSFTEEAATSEELQPLIAALSGAQIIGIGEATHGSHEDQSFKANLIKALIEHGLADLLILESNRQVGSDLDAYVVSGRGDLATSLRSPSFFRVWRTEEFADLILWIRAYNIQTDHPVHVIGVDCQDGGVDAVLALRFVSNRDRATASRLEKAFGPLVAAHGAPRFGVWATTANKTDYQAAMSASIELEALFAAHGPAWSALPGYPEAAYAAKTARQAFHAFELDGGRGDTDKDGAAYYGRRDHYMAENVLASASGRRGVFWAHDMHVLGEVPATDAWPTGYTWVGRELRHALGDRYQTVTFAWSQGAFRAQTITDSADAEVVNRKPLVPQTFPNDRAGDLGGVLMRVGPDRYWVDLRTLPQEAWAQRFSSTAYARGWAGWGVDAKTWNKGDVDTASLRPGTDILVWFRQITPSHVLPGDDF